MSNRLADLKKSAAAKLNALLSDSKNIQTLALWTSAVFAALISVAYAKLFRLAEAVFHDLLVNPGTRFEVFVASPVLFLVAWLLVRRYAPEAAGSGIPEIMAANEAEYSGDSRATVDRLLSVKTAL